MDGTAEYQVSGYRPGSPRERAVSSILSACVVLLVLLGAIYQSGIVQKFDKPVALTSFDVEGEQASQGDKAAKEKKQSDSDEPKPAPQDQKHAEPTKEKPVEPVAPEKPAFTFLHMSNQDFAMADIGKMAKAPPGGGASKGSGAVFGPGEGPGGAILHNADWYREPTDAQLGSYLPESHPDSGWGMIACQTIERYRVENCQILGESPRGSGFGRAVLNAAWQFQVVPPRVNGKPQVGEWVRIRIDYGKRGDG